MPELVNLFQPGPVAVLIWSYLPIGDAVRSAQASRICEQSFYRCLTRLELQRPLTDASIRLILRYNPPLVHVSIPDLDRETTLNLIPLEHVSHLALKRCGLRNINILSRCRRLRSLDLSGAYVTDIGAISQCSLVELSLAGTNVTSLLPIPSQLATLQKLDLSGTQIQDLTLLRNASRLCNVTLAGCNVNGNLPMFPDSVTTLDLTAASLDGLNMLPKTLKQLSLAYSRIQDVTALARFTELTFLDMSGAILNDLNMLLSLSRLQFLDISRTTICDLGPIQHSVMLRALRASHTPVHDVTPVSYCTRIEMLDLSYTKVYDLSSLSACTRLRYVNVTNTNVRHIGGIAAEVIGLRSRSTRTFQSQRHVTKRNITSQQHVAKRNITWSDAFWLFILVSLLFALQ